MKLTRRTISSSDRTHSRVIRLGVLALAIGVAAFGVIYYQDQHVDAGPSLVNLQIEGAEAAVRKAPGNIGIRLQLASAYVADKRTNDALKQYDEILKADKVNRPALLGRAGALTANGDLKGAESAYRKITGATQKGEFAGADPQLQEAYYYLGSIALKQGKTKEAITELEGALRITPSDSDALYLMGVARLKDGAPKLAVDSLKEALRFVPTGWCEPYTSLAEAHKKLGQAPQATYAGAMAEFCQKRPAEATSRLKTLITGPVAIEALMGLGLIAETGSNKAEAISWYQKVLTMDRTNVSAISALTGLGAAPPAGPKAKASSTNHGKG
jgi:tetratricopeptide (TPR) repeat protein